jgi:hypothetical protein
MKRYPKQFQQFNRKSRLRGQRARAGQVIMDFCMENADKYPTQEALMAAAKAHLQNNGTKPEYGGFIISFIIGPIIAALIGQIVKWVWERRANKPKPDTEDTDESDTGS